MTPYQEKARDQESEEALEQRLARVTAHRRQSLASETAEERQTRLFRRRVRLTDRRSAEMAEEWETQVRLNLQVNQQQLLETETQDVREARLHGLQQQTFAAKTPEEGRQRGRDSYMRQLINISILSPTSPSTIHLGAHSQTRKPMPPHNARMRIL